MLKKTVSGLILVNESIPLWGVILAKDSWEASTQPISFVIWNFIWAKYCLSLFAAKSLGQYFTQIFHFIKRRYLTHVKFQIIKQIGCVDVAQFCSTTISATSLYRKKSTWWWWWWRVQTAEWHSISIYLHLGFLFSIFHWAISPSFFHAHPSIRCVSRS